MKAQADLFTGPPRVYVDAAVWPYGRMLMCHMVADNLEALHAMADKLGIARRWFQNKPGRVPHYDLCKAKRAKAIKLGAVEVTWRELVAVGKRVRADVCGNHLDQNRE